MVGCSPRPIYFYGAMLISIMDVEICETGTYSTVFTTEPLYCWRLLFLRILLQKLSIRTIRTSPYCDVYNPLTINVDGTNCPSCCDNVSGTVIVFRGQKYSNLGQVPTVEH